MLEDMLRVTGMTVGAKKQRPVRSQRSEKALDERYAPSPDVEAFLKLLYPIVDSDDIGAGESFPVG